MKANTVHDLENSGAVANMCDLLTMKAKTQNLQGVGLLMTIKSQVIRKPILDAVL